MKKAESIWREVEREAWEPGPISREVFEDLLHLYCAQERRCLMAETELGEFGALLVERCNENGRCHLLPGQPKAEPNEGAGKRERVVFWLKKDEHGVVRPSAEEVESVKNFYREAGQSFEYRGGGCFVLEGGENGAPEA